jgi:GntR family transcriptional repressor for pyruvate dehydrogenase complex
VVTGGEGLKRLKRTRLSDQAAATLKRLIVDGTYRSGTRLPTEKVLANELGVTRLTVREALSQLEAAGFTETRHGAGTFVTDLSTRTTLAMLAEMLMAGRELATSEALAMMELREIIFLGFVPALVERVSDGQVARMGSIVELEGERVGDPARQAELALQFDEALADVCNNFFLVLLMRSLRAVHRHIGELIFRQLGDDEAIINTQRAIVSALAGRSERKLSRALGTYLKGGTELLAAALESND